MKLLALLVISSIMLLIAPAKLSSSVIGRIHVSATVVEVRIGNGGRSEIQQLWNRDVSSQPVGVAYERCAFMGSGGVYGGGVSYCQATYVIGSGRSRGTITTQGPRHNRRFATYAIVGGTGIYIGAGGVLHVVPGLPGKLALTFLLR